VRTGPGQAKRLRKVAAGAMALTLTMGAVACGDDDDDASATLAPDVCAAAIEFGGAFVTAPQDPAEFPAFASDTVLPLIARIEAGATGPAADHVAHLEAVYQAIAETGDPSELETPAYSEATGAVGAMVFEQCGADQQSVKAVDYEFEGVPDEVDAGLVSVKFTNEGSEAHEMVMFRRADGATESLDELLALPEEESMAKIEMTGVTFASPGATNYLAADLEPGTYFLVCFIPVGGGEEGEPHFMHGMKAELTVA
jgi:hypothetical protein